MPFLQWQSSYFRYQKSYKVDNYILSIVFVLFAYLIVFAVLYFSSYREKLKKIGSEEKLRSIPNIEETTNKIFYIAIGTYIIGLFFAIKNLILISSIGQSEYLSDRINFGMSRGIEILIPHWMYVACILFAFVLLVRRDFSVTLKTKVWAMLIISFCSVLIYYGINSNRNSILILLICLLFFFLAYQYSRSRITPLFLGKIAMLAFLFIMLFYQLGKLRRQAIMNNANAKYTIVEELNNAFGNHENIVWLLENKEQNKLHFGKTYIAGLTNFIPRYIWEDKPLGAGPILKNTIKPGAYVIGKPKNNSLTTGLLTELQMNFGVYGIFVGSLLFGFMLRSLGLLLVNTYYLSNILIIQYSLIILSSIFIYSEFLGFLSRYAITILPLLTIKFITNK